MKQESTIISMFGRQNYYFMVASAVLITIGFLLMIGGGSDDPTVFNPEELYSFRRITLAPIVVTVGFITSVFAIFWKFPTQDGLSESGSKEEEPAEEVPAEQDQS